MELDPRGKGTRALTLQLGAGQVDCRRVGGRPGADDDDLAMHPPLAEGLDLALVVGGALVRESGGSGYRESRRAGAEGAS